MGYSCTILASNKLAQILNRANNEPLNNFQHKWDWTINGNRFFLERGKEQRDGSITGTVYKFTDLVSNYARKYGSLKIEANGRVKRFPGMPSNILN